MACRASQRGVVGQGCGSPADRIPREGSPPSAQQDPVSFKRRKERYVAADTIIESVRAIAADLGEVPPAQAALTPARADSLARVLDRLAEETAEAAGMVRTFAASGEAGRSPR
jgi:hypothetical protein